jgi:hypothetical protein
VAPSNCAAARLNRALRNRQIPSASCDRGLLAHIRYNVSTRRRDVSY